MKVAIIGSRGVGKTNYLNSIRKIKYEPRWIPTLKPYKVTVDEIDYTESPSNLSQFDFVLVMYDCTSRSSYQEALDLASQLDSKKFWIVSTKEDIKEKQITNKNHFKLRKGEGIVLHDKLLAI